MLTQHRVNRLRLKADTYADVQQTSLLIEDALRTASFPGVPKNGVVFIQRLQLGKIPKSTNSKIFSQRIEQQFLSVRASVISLGQEEQPSASVVWFADDIQAYVLLSRLLMQGVAPESWYWPLAAPEWRRSGNPCADLPDLIKSVSSTERGVFIISAIVDRLLQDDAIERLIEMLSSEDADTILRNIKNEPVRLVAGKARDDSAGSPLSRVAEDWQRVLVQWIPILGLSDSRAVLLAISAAVSSHLPVTPHNLSSLLHYAAESNINTGVERNQPGFNTSDSAMMNATLVTMPESVTKSATSIDNVDTKMLNQQDAEVRNQSTERHLRNPEGLHDPKGLASNNAGLSLLINILQQLSIQETLEQFPLLVTLDLPNQLLWKCVEKLGIDSDDAMCRWLTPRNKLPQSKGYCPFVVPQRWLTLLFSQHRRKKFIIRQSNNDLDINMLVDSSGLVVLALWRGAMPKTVRELIETSQLEILPSLLSPSLHVPSLQTVDELQLILSTYLFAIRRYLWLYAGKGLKHLVAQSGHVAITQTHLDISFPMRQVDIAVRKVGLDIDPGWVPWLRRIVQFHYLEDEYYDYV